METVDQNNMNQGSVPSQSLNQLATAAKAAKLAALLSIIWVGVMVLTDIANTFSMLSHGYYGPLTLVLSVFGLAGTGLFIIPILQVFKFHSRINLAVVTNNQNTIGEGFEALKKAGKWVFILAIVNLSLWSLSFLNTSMYAYY